MKTLFTAILLFLSWSLNAQNFLRGFGGINNDEALAIDQDNSGNTYTTGYFNSSMSFGSNSVSTNGMSDVFVAKNTSIGGTQWIFSGGSSGPDRGFDIESASDGSTVVTGYHSHNANFGGTILSNNGLSQDFFVLKLNPSGEVEWVRGFGGEQGDTGYAVDIDPSGNILVTGQFRGTIDFDGTVFTSTPIEGGSLSYDTFILKMDPSGNVIWAKQGQNAYESRGLDIKSDGLGNVVVCGQFSDTLTFDQTHNNDIFNAAFVVQFDADGNEQWFRRFTSSQTIAYALEINSSNEIYITGDNIGPMLFYTESGSNYFPNEYTYNLFLAKFNTNGELLWLTNNGSENPVSSKDIAFDEQESPYITGTFNCRFDEYSEEYGSGIFYSAGWRDVFISKFSQDGEREWSRHMASNRDSYCSAITLKDLDMPIIAGSFENRFVVSNSSSFVAHNSNNTNNIGPLGNCGDDNYGRLRNIISEGNKDIFITAPVDLSREPIDLFYRPEANCEREYRPVCVNQCLDSLVHCGPTEVVMHDFIYSHLSPLYSFEWTSPDAFPSEDLDVPSTGTYYWSYEREDGCMSFADTLHATINPIPSPTITDSQGVNIFAPPHAQELELCYPDSVLLMGSNFSETDSIWWHSPGGGITPTDTDSAIYAHSTTGFRFFNIMNEFGCTKFNRIRVDVFFPIDSVQAEIIFPNHPEPVDTISICEGSSFTALLSPTDSAGNGVALLNYNAEIQWFISPSTGSISQGSDHLTASVSANTSGYHTISVQIDEKCDSTDAFIERTVYIEILPSPNASVSIFGPGNICPGDSVILTATGNIAFNWNGPNHIQLTSDSILAWNSGNYSISGSITNEFGCSTNANSNFNLSFRPTPIVTMLPASGIVCPGDSVFLTTENGLDYVWVGPQGQVIGTGQSIYVDIPGFYHCIVTDLDSCTLESNFVEVKEYASPYLIMNPGNDLCISGSVEIEAITDPSATVWWGPPLNSSNHSVTVSNAGVYTATVTLCGISTTQSVTIYETSVNAFITINDPPTVCNGSSVLLTANTGMDAYEWMPGGETTTYLWVTEPGIYTLHTYDEQGCEGVSQPVEIFGEPVVNLNLPPNLFICPQDSVLLSVEGNFDTYNWSPSGETTASIWITETGTYQVEVIDANGCTGLSEPAIFQPGENPALPIAEDLIHCAGDDLTVNLPGDGDTYWLGDEEPQAANPLIIESLESDTLLYYFIMADNGCTSEVGNFLVQVVPSAYTPIIMGDTVVCMGDSIFMSTSDMVNSTYSWSIDNEQWSQESEFGFLTDSTFSSPVNIVLDVNVANCAFGQQTAQITLLPLPEPLPIYGNSFPCDGETAVLHTTPPDSINIVWNWEGNESIADSIEVMPPGLDSILVQLTTSLNGCSAIPSETWVNHQPYPVIDSLMTNSPVCAGELLSLSATTDSFAGLSITTPTGFTYPNSSLNIFQSDTLDTGLYFVQSNSIYCQSNDSIWIEVYPVPDISLGNDSVYCEGNPAYFEIEGFDLVFWQDSIFSTTYQTSSEGMVKVEVINDFGCAKKDSVMVEFEACDGLLSNVFTPNGDGVNDYFFFNPYDYEQLRVIIYNRWGKVVCELNNVDHWDGNHCKTGLPVSHGTYFYIVEYATRESVPGIKKGYLQVFR